MNQNKPLQWAQYMYPICNNLHMKNQIPKNAIKITKNPGEQKMPIHWASICAAKVYDFDVKK